MSFVCVCVCVCVCQMEEAELRSWIEKLQARLQSCCPDSPQQLQAVLESVVIRKQSLCETLQSWNSRYSASTPSTTMSLYCLHCIVLCCSEMWDAATLWSLLK